MFLSGSLMYKCLLKNEILGAQIDQIKDTSSPFEEKKEENTSYKKKNLFKVEFAYSTADI